MFVATAHASVGPAPVCLRNCSNNVGPAGGWKPKSSTRCQLPVKMLAVELKCESTPEFTHDLKKYPSGRMAVSRGILCRPSGANVSEYRTPPPNVTTITLFADPRPAGSCARSHPGRIRFEIESPASCRKRRFDRLGMISTP